MQILWHSHRWTEALGKSSRHSNWLPKPCEPLFLSALSRSALAHPRQTLWGFRLLPLSSFDPRPLTFLSWAYQRSPIALAESSSLDRALFYCNRCFLHEAGSCFCWAKVANLLPWPSCKQKEHLCQREVSIWLVNVFVAPFSLLRGVLTNCGQERLDPSRLRLFQSKILLRLGLLREFEIFVEDWMADWLWA